MSDNALYALCKDRQGGIWIGSYFGGINYLPKTSLNFEKYFPTLHENSLSGNAIREITQDKNGNLWIGSEDAGLTKYDPKKTSLLSFAPIISITYRVQTFTACWQLTIIY
ncbi:two-component regulator propeller domain-containing protein [Niabella ginsengisoli]|uniref:Two component regulator three Y domain-containing protein n=1 Tax=Niabella ginsengisoli TaxID=522298 RepID=A0ABS9SL02_9BACT|nr:two-component regulator propeller domain-containing protein [Niabella ginsengisoli]MCH5599069.1 hypothetical protein [Niabella ginsengisoli]